MTAVEWLEEELKTRYGLTPTSILLFRDAKEMEKQQQDEFAIGFAEWSSFYREKNRNSKLDMLHAKSKYDESYTTKELLEIYKKEKGL